jgi:ParB family chromosome partitioning protein
MNYLFFCPELRNVGCNRLPLLKLSKDILQVLREGKLEYTKAKEIAKVKDDSQRIHLLENAIKDSLSLSEIKQKIKELSSEKIALPSPKNDLQALTRRLNQQKLWEKDPRTWKKIEKLLDKVNSLSKGTALDSSDISDNNENTF